MSVTEDEVEQKRSIKKEEPQPVVLIPPFHPNAVSRVVRAVNPNEPILEGVDVSLGPTFSTKELGVFFFQRSGSWIRWLDRRGLLNRDALGREVHPQRDGNETNGRRQYTLADVEMTARILHQNAIIPATRLQITLQLVHLVALGYGLIPGD